MSIKCDTLHWKRLLEYATIMLFCIPIGVPLATAVLLWSRRREIESRETRDGGEELASLSMLFAQFAPNSWWAAPVDMLRRISLSTLLLFFTPAYQLVLALLICIFFTVTQREQTPWYDPSMDLVAYATGWETILCELGEVSDRNRPS